MRIEVNYTEKKIVFLDYNAEVPITSCGFGKDIILNNADIAEKYSLTFFMGDPVKNSPIVGLCKVENRYTENGESFRIAATPTKVDIVTKIGNPYNLFPVEDLPGKILYLDTVHRKKLIEKLESLSDEERLNWEECLTYLEISYDLFSH